MYFQKGKFVCVRKWARDNCGNGVSGGTDDHLSSFGSWGPDHSEHPQRGSTCMAKKYGVKRRCRFPDQ